MRSNKHKLKHKRNHCRYCDAGLISEVVVPLLSMSQSVLLCISTLLDSGNHYSKMMNLKDENGREIFENISITLVCDVRFHTKFYTKCYATACLSFQPARVLCAGMLKNGPSRTVST